MLDRTIVLGMIAGFALAMPVAAQAPAPTTNAAIEWPVVDCRTGKLTTTASQPRCQKGPVFNPSARGGIDCADEEWNVTARSPTNFGFAPLYDIRALVPTCAVNFPGGIAKALKGYPPSHKRYRVVGGEPDRRHLYGALYLCWRRKLQAVCQIRAAMATGVLWGGSRLALRASGEQRPGS
jgi:hypothetical protein